MVEMHVSDKDAIDTVDIGIDHLHTKIGTGVDDYPDIINIPKDRRAESLVERIRRPAHIATTANDRHAS